MHTAPVGAAYDRHRGEPARGALAGGRVEIAEVDGIPAEYAAAARRYLGDDVAHEYLAGVDQPGARMARIRRMRPPSFSHL